MGFVSPVVPMVVRMEAQGCTRSSSSKHVKMSMTLAKAEICCFIRTAPCAKQGMKQRKKQQIVTITDRRLQIQLWPQLSCICGEVLTASSDSQLPSHDRFPREVEEKCTLAAVSKKKPVPQTRRHGSCER